MLAGSSFSHFASAAASILPEFRSYHCGWVLPLAVSFPVSGGTPRYMELATELFSDNLRRYLAEEPLRNVVDVRRGY